LSNDITFTRDEVLSTLPEWTKVRDIVAGEAQIKSKGDLYLPRPNPNDESAENLERYDQYLFRASLFNATSRTLSGLIGIAFRRWPEILLPPKMETLLGNLDGIGTGFVNQMQASLEGVLMTGRDGLFTDYPTTPGVTSLAQQKAEELRPTISRYRAENIINWRKDRRGRTVLVVLYEQIEQPDGYGFQCVPQWRELTLEDSRYLVRIWQADDNAVPEVVEEFTPLDASGRPWTEIPFIAVGAIDNNIEIDRSPLSDLANLNLAHYRNSADYEESTFFVGQPTFAFAGLDEHWIKDVWDDRIYVGSRAAIPLPAGGSAELLQAEPNTLAGSAMERKEQQMIALGARLLTPGEAVRTAEQSRSETAAAHSVLSLACDNISQAYTKSLQWAARFAGENEIETTATIDTDFVGLMADPNLILAVVNAWQSGAIPTADKNTAMRVIGLIAPDKSDEDIAEEIEVEGGGLNMDAEETEPE
jgi:hypothetical protein